MASGIFAVASILDAQYGCWDEIFHCPPQAHSRLPRLVASSRHTPCFVRSRGAKTILKRFGLLAHDLLRRSFGNSKFALHKQKRTDTHRVSVLFWLRGWDLNLMTSGL